MRSATKTQSVSVVAFAIAASVLVALSAPAAVGAVNEELEVLGTHTGFGTGDEAAPADLTQATVSGTGDSASVIGPVGGDVKADTSGDDGTTFTWSESSPTTDRTLNLTGQTNTETETVSQTQVVNGESVALDVAGTDPATDASVTFTGTGGSEENIGQNEDDVSYEFAGADGGTNIKSSIEISPEQAGEIDSVSPYVEFGSSSDITFDVYMSKSTADSTFQEGTKVGTATYTGASGDGVHLTVDFDTPYAVDGSSTYEVEFVTTSAADPDNSLSIATDTDTAQTGLYTTLDGDITGVADIRYSYAPTTDPSIDIDGDGSAEASSPGTLSNGQSVTLDLPNIPTVDDTADVSLSSGSVDVDVTYTERTVGSVRPGAVLNGATYDHDGTLAPGETKLITVNSGNLVDGTNNGEITLNDSGLSADAPPMTVRAKVVDGFDTAAYTSANYTGASGITTVAVNWSGTATLDVALQGWDGSSWQTVGSGTLTTTGNQTVGMPASGYSKTRVKIDVSDGIAEIHDETILFEPSGPTASNLQPADETELNDASVNFSVDVSDSDFGTAQGDQLTVDYYVDGENRATKTATSNGTVTAELNIEEGGSHSWYAVINDSYGESTTTATRNFSSPQTLTLYDEETLNVLEDANASVQVYVDEAADSDPTIIEANVTNGTIDFAELGLPPDRSFVVVADAPGYLPRRIFVPSLYDTQRAYLLPNETDHVESILELRDYSGQFRDENTVLLVQRGLNGSYQTVQGDYFGATGEFSVQLAYNVRHRLVLYNTQTDEREVLGTYTPLSDGRQIVEVTRSGDVNVLRSPPIITTSPSIPRLAASPDAEIGVTLQEQATPIANWSATVTASNTTGSEVIATTSSTTSTSATIPVDLSNRTGNVTIDVTYNLENGQSGTYSNTYDIRAYAQNDYSLLSVLGSFTTMIPAPNVDSVTTLAAVIITVIGTLSVAGALRPPTEAIGATAFLFLAVFGVVGWVGYGLPFVAGVTVITFSGLRRTL